MSEQDRRNSDDGKDQGQNYTYRKGRAGQRAEQEGQVEQDRARRTVVKNGQDRNRMRM